MVSPTVHTNPDRNGSFHKMLFKPEEFQNSALCVSVKPENFANDDVLNYSVIKSNSQEWSAGDCWVNKGAFHSTKYSGLKFRVFIAMNRTVFSVSLDRPRLSGSKFRAKIRSQTEDSFTFVYLLRGFSTTLKLKWTICYRKNLKGVRDYIKDTIPLYFPDEFKSNSLMTSQLFTRAVMLTFRVARTTHLSLLRPIHCNINVEFRYFSHLSDRALILCLEAWGSAMLKCYFQTRRN